MLGIRHKLFLASSALVVVVIVGSGIYLSSALRERNVSRTQEELVRHADIIRIAVENLPAMPEGDAGSRWVRSYGEAAKARVTLIQSDGRIAADTELDTVPGGPEENRRKRPEVADALEGRTGSSRRFSTTTGHDMLYVAVPFTRPEGKGVVRVSRSIVDISEELKKLYWLLAVAGFLGLGLGVGIAWFSSRKISSTMEHLVDYTRRLSEGERKEPFPQDRKDEIGGIAGSVYHLAQQLESRVSVLARERNRFEAILDGMSEAVICLDREGRINLINKAGIRLLALEKPPDGQTLLETIRVPELYDLALNLGTQETATAEFDLPTRTVPRVLVRAARSAMGETVLVLLDVSDLRRLEAIRRDFVANVSHELRTPVSVIRANAETLLEGGMKDPAAGPRFLKSLVDAADKLSQLISDLLDISRIESGALRLEMKPIDVKTAFSSAWKSLADKAGSKSINMEMEVPEGLLVWADERALDQVLTNLIDNAVKYTPEGGRVHLSAVADQGMILFSIQDNGPGIDSKHRSRLFERFYRVNTGRSTPMTGTGLGLAIVKHLTMAMGGSVSMTPAPAPDCGSVFRVELESADNKSGKGSS